MNEDLQTPGWIRIDNTEAERVLLIAGVSQRQRHPQPLMRALPWAIGCIWIAGFRLLLDSKGMTDAIDWAFALVLVATLLGVQSVIAWERLRRVARAFPATYRIAADTNGIALESEAGSCSLPWSGVEALVRHGKGWLIHLKSLNGLYLPTRCFSDPEEADAWFRHAEQCSGLRRVEAPPELPGACAHGLWQGLRDLLSNLQAGLLFAAFRARAVSHLRVSGAQILLVAAASLLLGLGFDLYVAGTNGSFNWYALPGFGCSWLIMLLCAWAVASCSPHPDRLMGGMLAIAVCSLVLQLPQMAVYAAMMRFPDATLYLSYGTLAACGWLVLALIVALVRSFELPDDQRMAAVLGVVFSMAASIWLGLGEARLWVAAPAEGEQTQNLDWQKTTRESMLYSQPALLDESLAAVKPGLPGKPELFLLAMAGYGSQDVFKREVESVESLFAERFSTAGHSVVLVNNPGTLDSRPLASLTALKRSLADIGRKMNPEDVLFLFMTSHGASDFRFSLQLWPYRFDELSPEALRDALDAAGIRHRVIVVSACYSGGFVPALAGPDTLVMSASRADRNSHGCSHEAEWTFFGKAYFNEALRETRDFPNAFRIASEAITKREDDEGLIHSEPQIQVGDAIVPVLDRLKAELEHPGAGSAGWVRPFPGP